jgi:hypothetical protein
MILENRKVVASFEAFLMVVYIFAFSFLMAESNVFFEETVEENTGDSLIKKIIDKLREPMIQIVSAAETIGCCERDSDGFSCISATANDCSPGVQYSPGVVCESASFCTPGCCFDPDAGIYSANVLEKDCHQVEWDGTDRFCNMPGAELGCCVLGLDTKFLTLGACEVFTNMAFADEGVVEWIDDMGQNECILHRTSQEQGACVQTDSSCEFTTQELCLNSGGEFSIDTLCTSALLDTSCEKTDKTTCIDGRDQVYFIDSCGNIGNIYDSSRVDDQSYWETKIDAEDSCGYNDNDGNANSASCGNCHRFAGGFCSLAISDDFDVEYGSYYCKSTSCNFDGGSYKNGESFCGYDGKVGDGDDIVGSLHRSYYCDYGEMDTLLCGDYRNRICATKDSYNTEGSTIDFRDSECLLNPWRSCLALNDGGEDVIETCKAAPYCRVEEVHLGSLFEFEFCTPEYPGGWSFSEGGGGGSNICGLASRTCTVYYEPRTFGGCDIIDNGGCLEEKFASGMNDFCRKLGDCGLEVNIAGEYTKNHEITADPGEEATAPQMNEESIAKLVALAGTFSNFVPWFDFDPLKSYISNEEVSDLMLGGGGSSGKGSAAALQTAAVAIAVVGLALILVCPICALVLIVIALILYIFSLFQDDCDPEDIEFTCRPWAPPVGGANCDLCNDELEICTEYRCQSLGAACELINKGSIEQACFHFGSGDSIAPILNPSEELNYDIFNINVTQTSQGHIISSSEGGCLEPNTLIPISVATDERVQCKYAFEPTDWESMTFLGENLFTLEHTLFIQLPDPSHGQSLGVEFFEDMRIYVVCQDVHGNMGPIDPYVVEMCVNQGPDVTPPVIYSYSPESGSYVSFDATSSPIMVTTNELATCRWDIVDQNYTSMNNDMECNDTIESPSSPYGYLCSANVSITEDINNYYIRCADQPWLNNTSERNLMTESRLISIKKPISKIKIESAGPNEDFKIPTEFGTVEVTARTSSGGDFHYCRYTFDDFGSLKGDILSEGDGVKVHKKVLSLAADNYEIYIECFDETGDFDREIINFEIIHDTSTPGISRVWQESNLLNVITSEFAECKYSTNSCRFNWDDGTSMGKLRTHTIDVIKGETYYIKCSDEFGNVPSGCSIQVEAT